MDRNDPLFALAYQAFADRRVAVAPRKSRRPFGSLRLAWPRRRSNRAPALAPCSA